jgi:hypothetical protein
MGRLRTITQRRDHNEPLGYRGATPLHSLGTNAMFVRLASYRSNRILA